MILYISLVIVVFITALCIFRSLMEFLKSCIAWLLKRDCTPRFRKRDKYIFYIRKFLRRVGWNRTQTGNVTEKSIFRRVVDSLSRQKIEQPTLQLNSLKSQAFLEEIRESPIPKVPPEVMCMLNNIRIFGFTERSIFLELCKTLQDVDVSSGEMLFSVGDLDDSIYVVKSGHLSIFITENGSEIPLKEVKEGESITSLLSIMDVLIGHLSTYKTVSARAIVDSSVVRLHVRTLKAILEKDPESLVRTVQAIMVRLQFAMFTALHRYLGLTSHLIQTQPKKKYRSAGPKERNWKLLFHHSDPNIPSTVARQMVDFDPFSLRKHGNAITTNIINWLSSWEDASSPDNENQQLQENDAPRSSEDKKFLKGVQNQRKTPKDECTFPESPSVLHNYEELQQKAVKGFMFHLGIQDETLVKNYVVVKEHPAAVVLVQEDSLQHADLFYVLSGCLTVSKKTVGKIEDKTIYTAYPGEIVGALAVTTGDPSVFTIKTKHPSRLGVIAKDDVYQILRKTPFSILRLSDIVVSRLTPFVRQIDFAIDWVNVESGKAIYRQGDESDCMYILLSGRLRSVLKRVDEKKILLEEHGRGDLVGIVELLTHHVRSTTVMAVRNSELAKIPEGLMDVIKIKYPEVVQRFVRLLGNSILSNLQNDMPNTSETMPYFESRTNGSNFTTVAIIAVNKDVPLSAFTMELYHPLSVIGSTLRLTSEIIQNDWGPTALSSANEYRLCIWLGHQEDQYKTVLYQCDLHFSAWTERCIRQADCILIVALADQDPTVTEIEKQMERMAVKTQKELVLLHREERIQPRSTAQWLNNRSWCFSHHHISCPKRMFLKRSNMKMMEMYKNIWKMPPNNNSDFSRLARFLTGKLCGLVLGGGGARGASHLGILKVLLETGIPIDMVGGVSIGSFLGALWCQERDITTVIQKAKSWAKKIASYKSYLFEWTFPRTSCFTGQYFNHLLYEIFGDRQIEDLWIPYFTVTTDITSSAMRVHSRGSLWHYIRGSMTLSLFLPPICDPADGHLLMDGGYVNNLPADIMRRSGAEQIFAVDVGSQQETKLTNYGDSLSFSWWFWKRYSPWAEPINVPSLFEIQSRLAYICCMKQLSQLKNSNYCTYLRPPIDKYETMQFSSFPEIIEIGYAYGKEYFAGWNLEGRILSRTNEEMNWHGNSWARRSINNASLTDLAEMIISPRYSNAINVDNDDEEDDDEIDSEWAPDSEFGSEPDKGQHSNDLPAIKPVGEEDIEQKK